MDMGRIEVKMSEKSLKGKMKTMIGAKTLPEFNFYFADEVKSAVQGLLAEIEDMKWKLQPFFEEQLLISEIKQLIKKYFPEEVKNE